MEESYSNRKHCGKRRNCLLRTISPFSSVFRRLVSQGRQKVSLCGNGLITYMHGFGIRWLTHCHTMATLEITGIKDFKTQWEKGKMLVTSIFAQSHIIFHSILCPFMFPQCFQRLFPQGSLTLYKTIPGFQDPRSEAF